MPRSPDFALEKKSSAGVHRRRVVLGGLVCVGVLAAVAALLWLRHVDHRRARLQAAKRSAAAAAQSSARAAATQPQPGNDPAGNSEQAGGLAILGELRRGVLAAAPGLLSAAEPALAVAPALPPAAGRSGRGPLAELTARPGLPWLPVLLHGAPIHDASISPDGALLLTAGADGMVRIYDAETGHDLAELRMPARAGAVHLARFSPDGLRVALASSDGEVALWDSRNGTVLLNPRLDLPPGAVRDVTFAPDGRLLAVATASGTSYLVDSRTGTTVVKLTGHHDEATMTSFSPDGTRIVSASADGTVRLHAVATGATLAVCKAHPLGARLARFSPDGQLVLTAGNDATARVFTARSLVSVAELHGHRGEVLDAHFSSDSSQIITASADATARLWDARTGRPLATLVGHAHPLSDAMLSPDGALVLTAAVDGEARLWSSDSANVLAVLRGHKARLTAVEFTADGERVMTAGLDGTARMWTARALAAASSSWVVRHPQLALARFSPVGDALLTVGRDGTAELWDARDGQHRRALPGHAYAVNAAAYTADGSRLLTVGDDGAGRVFDARSGLLQQILLGHTHPVHGVSVSPDGLLAVTVDLASTVRLWSLRDGEALGLLAEPLQSAPTGTAQQMPTAAFSPDGERLVTVSAQGVTRLWNVHTLTLQASLPRGSSIHAVDFSPDGRRLLTAADDVVQLWDTRAAGPVAAAVATLSGHSGELTIARFAPDGAQVVSGATDHTARVYDVASRQVVVTLGEHTGTVRVAAWSPDGQRLLTGDSDGLALVWEAATGKVLHRVRGASELVSAEFSRDGHSLLLARDTGEVQVVALSVAPAVIGACRLLHNHAAEWSQVSPACEPLLHPLLHAALPSAPRPTSDGGLWAPTPEPAPVPMPMVDGGGVPSGVLEAPAWRRNIAPRSHEVPAGCFAYSAKLRAAACRVRTRATAGSPRERVLIVFVPPVFPEIVVEPELAERVDPHVPPLVYGSTLATLQARLAAGNFAPLPATSYRPLVEGKEVPLGTARAAVSWLPAAGAPKTDKPGAHVPGERILQVRCSNGKRLDLQKFASQHRELTAAMAPLPDGKRLSFRIAASTPATSSTHGASREERVLLLDPRSCALQAPPEPPEQHTP